MGHSVECHSSLWLETSQHNPRVQLAGRSSGKTSGLSHTVACWHIQGGVFVPLAFGVCSPGTSRTPGPRSLRPACPEDRGRKRLGLDGTVVAEKHTSYLTGMELPYPSWSLRCCLGLYWKADLQKGDISD